MPNFKGPKLKIERAKQHINDLNVQFSKFADSNYYALTIDENPDTGEHFLNIAARNSLPEYTATIVGDAVHNLRSSLDLAISDILFEKTGKRSDYAKFPFYPTRDALISAIKGGDIKQAPENILNLIVDVIKPYSGGNDALWGLHALDIKDKHLLLIPVVEITALMGLAFIDDQYNIFAGVDILIDAPRVALPIARGRKLQITRYGQSALAILFAEGLPFEGKPILPTLFQLTQLISGIIEAFDDALKA